MAKDITETVIRSCETVEQAVQLAKQMLQTSIPKDQQVKFLFHDSWYTVEKSKQ